MIAHDYAEKIAEAAARRAALDDDDAAAADDDDAEDAAASAADGATAADDDDVEDDIDEVAAARAQGPEAMFNVGVAKVWNAKTRLDIAKGRTLLLGKFLRIV